MILGVLVTCFGVLALLGGCVVIALKVRRWLQEWAEKLLRPRVVVYTETKEVPVEVERIIEKYVERPVEVEVVRPEALEVDRRFRYLKRLGNAIKVAEFGGLI